MCSQIQRQVFTQKALPRPLAERSPPPSKRRGTYIAQLGDPVRAHSATVLGTSSAGVFRAASIRSGEDRSPPPFRSLPAFLPSAHDCAPQAPVHFLVIPKSRDGLTQLSKAVDSNKALLGHLMFVAQKVAKEQVRA